MKNVFKFLCVRKYTYVEIWISTNIYDSVSLNLNSSKGFDILSTSSGGAKYNIQTK